jgi:L-ribulose-5-phosphate 3-epimerase
MNKRDFIKSAAVIAGAAAVTPLSATAKSSISQPVPSGKGNEKESGQVSQGTTLKKSLGFAMIKEDLPLVDKFKLMVDLGFHGVELNAR